MTASQWRWPSADWPATSSAADRQPRRGSETPPRPMRERCSIRDVDLATARRAFARAKHPGHAVMPLGMTHRVGTKGQVVIPKALRDELGIEPGDEVSFWRHGDHVAVRPASQRRVLRGRFVGSSLTDALLAERDADRRRESAR